MVMMRVVLVKFFGLLEKVLGKDISVKVVLYRLVVLKFSVVIISMVRIRKCLKVELVLLFMLYF